MNSTWDALLNSGQYSQTQPGVAYSNSVTLTDVSPGGNIAGEAFTLPAAYLHAGQQYRIRANGIVSTSGTPTLSLGVYLGGVAGTALATTGALATASTLSSAIWKLEADMRVESEGTSGAVRCVGHVNGIYGSVTLMPATSGSGNEVTVNTGASQILTIGAQWGTASASNSLQVMMFTVERLNEGSS